MSYKINFTLDFSEMYATNPRHYLLDVILHYVEIPFVRQHDNEWQYLRNWSARRDKNYMTTEAFNRKQDRDLKRHNLLVLIAMRPIWDWRQLDTEGQELLEELQSEGKVDYDTDAKEYAVTNSGRAYLEGRTLPDIVIPPYED